MTKNLRIQSRLVLKRTASPTRLTPELPHVAPTPTLIFTPLSKSVPTLSPSWTRYYGGVGSPPTLRPSVHLRVTKSAANLKNEHFQLDDENFKEKDAENDRHAGDDDDRSTLNDESVRNDDVSSSLVGDRVVSSDIAIVDLSPTSRSRQAVSRSLTLNCLQQRGASSSVGGDGGRGGIWGGGAVAGGYGDSGGSAGGYGGIGGGVGGG